MTACFLGSKFLGGSYTFQFISRPLLSKLFKSFRSQSHSNPKYFNFCIQWGLNKADQGNQDNLGVELSLFGAFGQFRENGPWSAKFSTRIYVKYSEVYNSKFCTEWGVMRA